MEILKQWDYLYQKKGINPLLDLFNELPSQKTLERAFFESNCVQLRGLVGSGFSFRIASAFQNNPQFLLIVMDDAEQAAYYLNDFEQLLSPSEVLYFPASYRQPYAPESTDNANILLRAEAM